MYKKNLHKKTVYDAYEEKVKGLDEGNLLHNKC